MSRGLVDFYKRQLVTSAMIWKKQLRNYVVLPSWVAVISGLLVILMCFK
ncbi:DUF1435 family protein [Enterobacter hormaechei]